MTLIAPPSVAYHSLDIAAAADALSVDVASGLDAVEAERRLAQHGPNRLASAPRRPAWRQYLDQFRNFLIVILIGAAAVSLVVSKDVKTAAVVLVVVVINASLGFVQERRADASLEALRKMLVSRSRVRRQGEAVEIDAEGLVPGDIVLVEAGDRIPADGRLLVAVNLEVDEAALTGESHASPKDVAPVDAAEVALGDRRNSVFMNTTVTRGRAEVLVTATGMSTEIGRIAGLLRASDETKTPLQQQLDHLAHALALLAGAIVVLVFAIGLARGESVGDLFLTAVALAVATIPEGLPAVVAVTLAIGTSKMAKRNAIVKRLASVETLGCTSVICSDKTGTLTLNQMTAREVVYDGRSHAVSGEGYSLDGTIVEHPGEDTVLREVVLLPMALCSDASLRVLDDGTSELVGDPTEGALVVLAAKGGLDIAELRARYPRLAEVPFDSATKLMATFHSMHDDTGREVVRLYAKGAPDVLLALSRRGADPAEVNADNERLASQGRRVLAVAERDLDSALWAEFTDAGGDPAELVDDLTFLALVGILDPPRPEAEQAIAECRDAGITVKMITGDHAATAAAIGRELGLHGVAVTGADLDAMSDAELADRIDGISVFARVAPEHKMRLVKALQANGHVVGMTGDGVNDAPALKAADIGIAMGLTGTEVTKEAATMVLTDDNFATIVKAVRQGRTIYDNILSFVRFQLSTTLGFAFTFLVASVLGIAGGAPFTAVQILWVNLIMDGPPAMALGVDPPAEDTMRRAPRPLTDRILTPRRLAKLVFYAVVMGTGTLLVMALAPGADATAGETTVAGTMGFTTFVAYQLFSILNARDEHRSVFRRSTLRNRWLWWSLLGVTALQVVAVTVAPVQSLFHLTSLSATQWLVCFSVGSSILWLEEIRKLFVRRAVHPS
jgi:P-type Ca2+ transporter type 2C